MPDHVPNVPGGPHLRTIAMPRDANAGGAIFGGWTLSQMDLADGTFWRSVPAGGWRRSASRRCASSVPSRSATR